VLMCGGIVDAGWSAIPRPWALADTSVGCF
jgi:hypothetical protein